MIFGKCWVFEAGTYSRAVERMVDFIRGPGKILKYDLKKVNFALLGSLLRPGPPFEAWAPVKITASPPPPSLTGPDI
jgi:hypothetical protein